MKKDFRLAVEKLETKCLLSSKPWYINSINASEVWDKVIINGAKPVVAVIDSGIDLNHDIFKNNKWINPYDKIDEVDNDGNGYIDDVSGWDFVQNDGVPQDEFYHGTHVAGIISLVSNNKVDILPLRFQNNSGMGYAGAAASAVNYAVDVKIKGANIAAINCSFGGLDVMPPVLETALRRANDNGIIVVLAAGNNGVNMDLTPKYPGSLKLINSITVGAINSDLSLAGYSNYGKHSVEIAAPGSDIYSALPNNTYGYISGSSMAAPMVSATIGLLKTIGNYSAYQIKNIIMQSAGVLSGLSDKVLGGLINTLNAWNMLKMIQPEVTPIIEKPKAIVIVPERKIAFDFDEVSGRIIKGWANISDKISKPLVEVYINGKLQYKSIANQYRYDTSRRDGFVISINRRLLKYKWNTVEVRIIDPMKTLASVIYKKQIRK